MRVDVSVREEMKKKVAWAKGVQKNGKEKPGKRRNENEKKNVGKVIAARLITGALRYFPFSTSSQRTNNKR